MTTITEDLTKNEVAIIPMPLFYYNDPSLQNESPEHHRHYSGLSAHLEKEITFT